MMNPIVIIVTISLILSVLVVSIINKPKKPIVTGTMIVILICYAALTFLVDMAITGGSESYNDLIHFLIMQDTPDYEALSDLFRSFMTADIILIVTALLSLFAEVMLILRKDSRK